LDPHAPAGLSELAAGDVSACAAAARDAPAAQSAPTLVGARVTAAAANCIATATATSGRVSAASTGRIAAVAAACGRDSAASVCFTSAAANAATAPAASPQFASGCRDADRRRLGRLSSAGAKLQNGDFCLETATN
jgi:hypothetical protein